MSDTTTTKRATRIACEIITRDAALNHPPKSDEISERFLKTAAEAEVKDGERLVFVASPWTDPGEDHPSHKFGPATKAELWIVPPGDGGGILAFLQEKVGGLIDHLAPDGVPFDCWLADDFYEVEGLNPLTTLLYGAEEGRLFPGGCVFACFDEGGNTTSLHPLLCATLAELWVRGAVTTAKACKSETLTLSGADAFEGMVYEDLGSVIAAIRAAARPDL